MNPLFYNEFEINTKTHKYAKETWEYDAHKKQICENLGIKLYVIWENDWKQNKDCVKNRIKEILELK